MFLLVWRCDASPCSPPAPPISNYNLLYFLFLPLTWEVKICNTCHFTLHWNTRAVIKTIITLLCGFKIFLPFAVKVHCVPWQKLQIRNPIWSWYYKNAIKVAKASKYPKLPSINVKNLSLMLLLFYAVLMTCFLNNKNFLCQAFNAVSLPESDKRNVCLD